jgi:mannose-1-phosphate guanylyltransferase
MNGASTRGHTWAIVLAAGSGTRLSSLTRDDSGNAVPKQFCSLHGGPLLIEQALARARAVVSRDRIMAIVSPAHVRYWKPALSELAEGNIIVQPHDRGTAVGILLPILCILARDPEAHIIILPSDHHFADESIIENALRLVIDDVSHRRARVVLLGIDADEPDPELGYIIPRAGNRTGLRTVHRFVEKPAIEEARRLCREGALRNSFILVSHAHSLVELYRRRRPHLVNSLQGIRLHDYAQLLQAYDQLPEVDFSRHIAADQAQRLAVMAVPRRGWNDIGTPHRLAQTLIRASGVQASAPRAAQALTTGSVILSEQFERMHRRGPVQMHGSLSGAMSSSLRPV